MLEMDRVAMHPSHFVAKLEVLESKTKKSRSDKERDLYDDDEEEEEEENWELPALTEQEIQERDAALNVKKREVAHILSWQ